MSKQFSGDIRVGGGGGKALRLDKSEEERTLTFGRTIKSLNRLLGAFGVTKKTDFEVTEIEK